MDSVKNVEVVQSKGVTELIPPHNIIYFTDLKGIKSTVAILFQTEACYSYNEIKIQGKPIRIASIETLMNMYLAFQYDEDKVDEKVINKSHLICAAAELYKIQKENRLAQRGVLKRFSMNCYGHQKSKAETMKIKKEKVKEMNLAKVDKSSKEYESWTLNYVPSEIEDAKKSEKEKEAKKKTQKKSKKRSTIKKKKTSKTKSATKKKSKSKSKSKSKK